MESQVTFSNPLNEALSGTLHQPDLPTADGVICGHCFTCSRNTRILIDLSKALAASGFAVLRFDFSGNGKSQGHFEDSSYSKHVQEMASAMEFMGLRGFHNISLIGHSMGASIALLTGKSHPTVKGVIVKGVCTLAGRLSGLEPLKFFDADQQQELAQHGQVHFQSRGRSLVLKETFFSDARQFDIPETIRSYSLPLLVVHGDRDEIIPIGEGFDKSNLYACGAELLVVPGADHMFSHTKHRDAVVRYVVAWLKRVHNF